MSAGPVAESQTEALDRLAADVEALERRGLPSVVVFDLDDTLFSTAQRHLRILREYARERGVAGLASLEARHLRYSIVDTAKANGFSDEPLLKDLRGYWFKRFFANEYLAADEPLPGAADYCRELARRGARVVYMTGRDESMRAGTERALGEHRFPTEPALTQLVLKPRFDTPDLEFKSQALGGLRAHGHVAGAFENEPLHVNMFRDAFPEALVFLLETKHSGKPVEAHASAKRIKDFRRG